MLLQEVTWSYLIFYKYIWSGFLSRLEKNKIIDGIFQATFRLVLPVSRNFPFVDHRIILQYYYVLYILFNRMSPNLNVFGKQLISQKKKKKCVHFQEGKRMVELLTIYLHNYDAYRWYRLFLWAHCCIINFVRIFIDRDWGYDVIVTYIVLSITKPTDFRIFFLAILLLSEHYVESVNP